MSVTRRTSAQIRLTPEETVDLDLIAARWKMSRSHAVARMIAREVKAHAVEYEFRDPEPDHPVPPPAHVVDLATAIAERARAVNCPHWRIMVRDGTRWCRSCGATLEQ